MKLPSRLVRSRHGVFYYRLVYRIGSSIKEKRISLRTKNPSEAKDKALMLSAIMLDRKSSSAYVMDSKKENGSNRPETPEDLLEALERNPSALEGTRILENLLQKVDLSHLADIAGVDLESLRPKVLVKPVRKMDVALPNGVVFRDIKNDEDAERMVQIIKELNLNTHQWAQVLAGPTPVLQAQGSTAIPASLTQAPADQSGITVQETIQRFATRKKKTLASKTFYEYSIYQQKFVEWLETRKRSKHIAIRSINRQDIADFIDDLLEEGLKPRTIQQKYLGAINGLFVLAQSSGALPDDARLVTYGHKIFTKRDAKKADARESYKPFTDKELELIFKPENLWNTNRPADFWLPLLALFTGGRISELSQLEVTDIAQENNVWSISINDEGDKSLKTEASRRVIPIHPTLINIGLLDYVEDAKEFGNKLFPYLIPDKFGSYGSTTSERFAGYLDKVGITDPLKVFHSFRSTSNNRLKNNGVNEESRCQFIGHEHDTVNSKDYSDPHSLEFLLENVASKLIYPNIEFDKLIYKRGQFSSILEARCKVKSRKESHLKARMALKTVKKESTKGNKPEA